ncbi:MAG: dockerin type I repeat-containing protein [Ruminococcus sp.]|nr:dockerin type I repeat-containing protein [Ruminococcus sp.]
MVFTTEHFSYYVITTAVSESEFELGDVNRDGKINIKDATAIQKYVAKLVEFDEEQLALADFNGDTKVNVKDATTIQKKIAGLI